MNVHVEKINVVKIVLYSILGILIIIGTYIYFFILDFIGNMLHVINLYQTVNGSISTWILTIWAMSWFLAIIAIFTGIAKGIFWKFHAYLEIGAAAGLLAFTILSYFIGCSIFSLGFAYTGFGNLDIRITVNLSGEVISLLINPYIWFMTILATAYASLNFVKVMFKTQELSDDVVKETGGYTYFS